MANQLLIILIILSMIGCDPQSGTPPEASSTTTTATGPSRRNLIRASRNSGEWLWVYAAQDSQAAAQYHEMLAIIEQDPPFDYKVKLKAASEVSAEDLARQPLVLLGTNWPASWREKMNEISEWELQEDGFHFADEDFNGAADVLQLSYYPNPWNQEWPIHFVTANNDKQLRDYLDNTYSGDWEQMFWGSWGYSAFKDGNTRFLGYFADTTWQIDPNNHFAFASEVETLHQTANTKWIGHELDPATNTGLTHLPAIVDSFSQRRDSLAQFLGLPIETKISFHLYNSVEDKGMRKQNMEPAQAIFADNEVHLVVNDFFRGDQFGEDMRLLLRKTLGKPKTNALEQGLALLFAPEWGRGKGPRYWAKRLYISGNLPSLSDLVDNELYQKESPTVMPVTAAAMVDFLIDHLGREKFLEEYLHWEPGSDQLRKLSKDWDQFLAQHYQMPLPEEQRKVKQKFLKGFTFAHEGYRVYNGYGSKAARRSLNELKSLGTDALSLVPYSYMRRNNHVSHIPVVRQAGTENDPATLFSHLSAKKLGMFSLLKPQIWVNGSWPGDIDFEDPKDWDLFFDYYYRWMRHYVLMAAIYDYDAIAVGTEFVKSTAQYPDRWRQMIKKWRKLYPGPFTYAANWGQEFENLAFWEEIDYLGCNCYYPLSKEDSVDQTTLNQGVAKMLDHVTTVAKKTGKPVWLTEIGYRSVTAPWQNPHAEPNGRASNPEHQAMAYEALLNTLPKYPKVEGVFIWKWPCYLEYSRRQATGFSPLGKPAEELWQKAFTLRK